MSRHCLRNRDARVKPAHDAGCRLLWHDLFRKPLTTPHQVQGGLFRDHALGAGDEIRRPPVPDRLGDDLHRVVFGVALRALLGEPLLRSWNVINQHAQTGCR
jgi:hypothetical protein